MGASSIISPAKKSKPGEGKRAQRTALKYPTQSELCKVIPQNKEVAYKERAGSFGPIVFIMINKNWLSEKAFKGAKRACVLFVKAHPDWAYWIENIPRLKLVDFSSLRTPRHDYLNQIQIEPRRVWLLATCTVHYDLDIGLIVRYVGGEYTAKWRDVESIIGAVEGLVSKADIEHTKHFLETGCPASLNWEEPP